METFQDNGISIRYGVKLYLHKDEKKTAKYHFAGFGFNLRASSFGGFLIGTSIAWGIVAYQIAPYTISYQGNMVASFSDENEYSEIMLASYSLEESRIDESNLQNPEDLKKYFEESLKDLSSQDAYLKAVVSRYHKLSAKPTFLRVTDLDSGKLGVETILDMGEQKAKIMYYPKMMNGRLVFQPKNFQFQETSEEP